jgi:hypothetical protein
MVHVHWPTARDVRLQIAIAFGAGDVITVYDGIVERVGAMLCKRVAGWLADCLPACYPHLRAAGQPASRASARQHPVSALSYGRVPCCRRPQTGGILRPEARDGAHAQPFMGLHGQAVSVALEGRRLGSRRHDRHSWLWRLAVAVRTRGARRGCHGQRRLQLPRARGPGRPRG